MIPPTFLLTRVHLCVQYVRTQTDPEKLGCLYLNLMAIVTIVRIVWYLPNPSEKNDCLAFFKHKSGGYKGSELPFVICITTLGLRISSS